VVTVMQKKTRLFESIVVFGAALPVAAVALPVAAVAFAACGDDEGGVRPDADTRPDAEWPYVWDAANPPDADVDAAPPDGAPDSGA
jgi:hypothetical protein